MESKYVNSLIHESSVYLQQHAHNPVDWYVWGEVALETAKRNNKPILISIGYSSCHWCHVMEKESFEDPETAKLMNEYFINIKVDREERPDLDQIYMEAVQILTGSGGWPLHVFLTPDGRPFFGGTYFPPVRAYNKVSWKEVLTSIHDAFEHRREEIEAQAVQLKKHIEDSNAFGLEIPAIIETSTREIISKQDCEIITEALLKNADLVNGGFGYAPKFPQTCSLQYLLQYAHAFQNKKAADFALLSIQKMYHGGIYDQLGGGLARYSTDSVWLAPHFEKMLYDNALFVILLADAYRYSSDAVFEKAIHKTLHFLMSEMRGDGTGYYAAIDADSENEEGKFYVWDKKEIEQILGTEAALYCAYYQVEEKGNWEGKNILHIKEDAKYWAEKFELSESIFLKKMEEANTVLLSERSKRIRPVTDDKMILSWNALMLKALTQAYAATGHEAYKEEAILLAMFLKETFTREKGYGHVRIGAVVKHTACLDDLAYWAEACICLQEITGDMDYLRQAKKLMEYIFIHFAHPEKPVFYFTESTQTDLFVRKVDLFDGALPSANAVVLKNLMYLSAIFDDAAWRVHAEAMLGATKEIVKKHPGSFSYWAGSFLNNAIGIEEIVLTGTATAASLKELLKDFFSNKVIISSNDKDEIPILQGRNFNKPVSIYVCRNNSCSAPVNTIQEMYSLIKNSTG